MDVASALATLTAEVRAARLPIHAITVEDAALVLGCGRTQVFALLKSGRLTRAKSFGKRTLITLASVTALQDPAPVQVRAPTPRPNAKPSARDMRARILSALDGGRKVDVGERTQPNAPEHPMRGRIGA